MSSCSSGGRRVDSAVLCSRKETFEVKEAEVSNSVLVLPPEAVVDGSGGEGAGRTVQNIQICGIFRDYLELKRIQPSLSKLLTVLEMGEPFAGVEKEPMDIDERLKSTDEELDAAVPASWSEIEQALKTLRAIKIGQHWRLLDVDYAYRVLNILISSCEANGWSLSSVDQEDCIQDVLNLLAADVAVQCFVRFFEENDTGNFRLNRLEVSRLLAEVLLKPAGKFNKEEFLKAWQKSMPEDLPTDLSDLKGMVLMDDVANPPVIWYFPSWSLPELPQRRFQVLFEEKPEWTADEIRPYLQDIVSPSVSADKLLLKYARMFKTNEVKMYRAKYAK
ncbi:unnamed protein product [Cyprideis torosa]|uniref:Sister chromatid cohesion protein DCC1 n=1 Tax=Cyprideis torosa TaxID=163714 RepID=A0A7R8WB87_9CRUS|nr:unnamed protein product [Cyprideis torosa]CAG0886050.1 unnamed protein product [Cyprideis torosa]